MVGGLNQDLRYALPQLGRSQAFAAVADCVVRRNRSSLVAQRLGITHTLSKSYMDGKRPCRRLARYRFLEVLAQVWELV
jgi:hypothetical protein